MGDENFAAIEGRKTRFIAGMSHIANTLKRIPTIEKYSIMIKALKLKEDIDSGLLGLDYAQVSEYLSSIGVSRREYNEWSKEYMLITDGSEIVIAKQREADTDAQKRQRENGEGFVPRKYEHIDGIFRIIDSFHRGTNHTGAKRTYEHLVNHYCNITRSMCEVYCAQCLECINNVHRGGKRPTVYATETAFDAAAAVAANPDSMAGYDQSAANAGVKKVGSTKKRKQRESKNDLDGNDNNGELDDNNNSGKEVQSPAVKCDDNKLDKAPDGDEEAPAFKTTKRGKLAKLEATKIRNNKESGIFNGIMKIAAAAVGYEDDSSSGDDN